MYRANLNSYERENLEGFSLLETLVALSIFSIVFLGVAEFLTANLSAQKLGSQLERAIAYSDSLLAQAEGVEDATIFANYNGDCSSSAHSNIPSISAWCYDFIGDFEYEDSKSIIFHQLNVKTSLTKVATAQNLKAFNLQISWKQDEKDLKFQKLDRTIYINQ